MNHRKFASRSLLLRIMCMFFFFHTAVFASEGVKRTGKKGVFFQDLQVAVKNAEKACNREYRPQEIKGCLCGLQYDEQRAKLLAAVQNSQLQTADKGAIQGKFNQDDCCLFITSPLAYVAGIVTLSHAPINAVSKALLERSIAHIKEKIE